MKYGILLLMTFLVAFSMNAYGHGGEKHQKPEKVSSAMMQKERTDTTHDEQIKGVHEGDTHATDEKVAEQDFDTIRSEVQNSTTFIVIKALALAAALIGFGAVYLPRKRKGNS